MSQELPIPPPGFDDLGVEEKLDYVAHQANPDAARPGHEVRAELAEKLRNFRSRRE
jgi:hypothetical protein